MIPLLHASAASDVIGLRMRLMVEFDALMANPYPVAVPFMLLGLALLGFALREGYARPRHAGVGCLGMSFGVWLAATLVETPAERAIPVVEALVAEVCQGQIEAARRRLHPEAGWGLAMSIHPVRDFPRWTTTSSRSIPAFLEHSADQRHHIVFRPGPSDLNWVVDQADRSLDLAD